MYRIFYYDCAPIDKTVYNPLTQKNFNFAKSPRQKANIFTYLVLSELI